jgi:hypothetical protein
VRSPLQLEDLGAGMARWIGIGGRSSIEVIENRDVVMIVERRQ